MKKSCTVWACGAALLVAGVFVGCESEPSGPRPQRAVRIDDDTMSPGSEATGGTFAGQPEGVPLVTVDLPNNKNDPVVVRTIIQNVQETFAPPATQSVGAPTTKPRVDPVFGQ